MDNEQFPIEQQGPDELQQLLDFFKRHGNILAYGISAVLVVLIISMGYKNYKASKTRQAWEKLWAAKSGQDFEIVLEDYPDSPAAPVALLKVAKAHFDVQKYSVSIKKYEAFLTTYPEHRFADIARLGKMHCQEALGQVNEALKGFTAYATQNPDHYLYPQATLGRARCLGHLGRADEAKAVYEEIIAAKADTGWATKAEAGLKSMERRAPEPVSVTVPIPSGTVPMTPGPTSNAAPLIDLSNFNLPK